MVTTKNNKIFAQAGITQAAFEGKSEEK